MADDEEEFLLEDLEKLGPIFRWTFTLLGLVVVGLITFAGYKGWAWFIAIPIGSALFLGCRILKRMFDNQIQEEKLNIKKKQINSSAPNKVSFDEFMEMSPQESDDEKLAVIRLKEQRIKNANPYQNMFAACFIMLMVGVFWYGVGRIIAL
jgi:hypothetical protein